MPPNICFLTKLQVSSHFASHFLFLSIRSKVLNISYNRLARIDTSYFSVNPSCLENLRTLDMSHNYFNEFPSLFLTKTKNLRRLFLQNNQLTSFDLALFVLASTSTDLSNNQISRITNDANVNISNNVFSTDVSIDLTNNSPMIDLTDSIYEMYGACNETMQVSNSSLRPIPRLLTISLLNINFGTSRINCSCDQYYIQRSLNYSIDFTLLPTYPLFTAQCTDGQRFYNNNRTAVCSVSSVNFTNTKPRLCTINPNDGNLILINTTETIPSVCFIDYISILIHLSLLGISLLLNPNEEQ